MSNACYYPTVTIITTYASTCTTQKVSTVLWMRAKPFNGPPPSHRNLLSSDAMYVECSKTLQCSTYYHADTEFLQSLCTRCPHSLGAEIHSVPRTCSTQGERRGIPSLNCLWILHLGSLCLRFCGSVHSCLHLTVVTGCIATIWFTSFELKGMWNVDLSYYKIIACVHTAPGSCYGWCNLCWY